MDYRRFGDRLLVRIDPGEEVLASLREICLREGIKAGDIRGLGASDDYDVCVYDLAEQKYYPQTVRLQSEITSLYGTISEKDGELYFHVHMQAMRKDGVAAGGHLQRCVISGTLEAVITEFDGRVGRAVNPQTGLNDIAFS